MGHTEADLKAQTVPKLKEILTEYGKPTTGKKDDLIVRILEHESGAPAGDAPAAEEAPAESEAPEAEAEEKPTEASPEAPKEKTPEEKEAENAEIVAKAAEEFEKRKKRAARFGEDTEELEKIEQRAKRFGSTPDVLISKTLVNLDKPLTERRRPHGRRGLHRHRSAPKAKA